MKILVIGGGGREHAIIRALSLSPRVERLYCAPGNAGIAQIAECYPDIAVMDFDRVVSLAREISADLVFVAPDDPLAGGLVDRLEYEGIRAFGPKASAAILEGSKAFAKDLMRKYHIPTADYETFDDEERAVEYVKRSKLPVVLKANGLALGKGVLICDTVEEAIAGLHSMMSERRFGMAGSRVVIEEFLTGPEFSVLAFTDGRTIRTMSSSEDYKRAGDGGTGPNTGGMGNVSPNPFYTPEIDAYCMEHIYRPTVEAMAAEGRRFQGVIFFGLILTKDGPKVLEYNARFGDPEAEVILPRMKTDLLTVCEACIDGTLDRISLDFTDDAAVCLVLASGGYPVSYRKGMEITGLSEAGMMPDTYVYHAGTRSVDGRVVTNGGRVLDITSTGPDIETARKKAYQAAELIHFDGMYMRSDIGR